MRPARPRSSGGSWTTRPPWTSGRETDQGLGIEAALPRGRRHAGDRLHASGRVHVERELKLVFSYRRQTETQSGCCAVVRVSRDVDSIRGTLSDASIEHAPTVETVILRVLAEIRELWWAAVDPNPYSLRADHTGFCHLARVPTGFPPRESGLSTRCGGAKVNLQSLVGL